MSAKKIAQALDSAAAKTSEAGTRLAGAVGGRVADALVNATVAPVRRLVGHDNCTRPDCDHS